VTSIVFSFTPIEHNPILFLQTKVGSWNSLDHLSLSRVEKISKEGGTPDPMANKTFVITAILVRFSSILLLLTNCLEPTLHNAGGVSQETDWKCKI
jgi:hypothetical protein